MGRRAIPHVTGAYDGANFRAWSGRSRANLGVDCLGCPGTRRCSGLADQPGRITAGIAARLWDSPSHQRHTAARLSCSSIRCWGGQPGDCGPDTNRLAVHEQRLDRKMRQDRGNSTAIAFGSVPRASGGLVTATRCRADVSAVTASAAPRAGRRGRRSKRDPRHRSVRLRCHRTRRGRTVVCHQKVAKRSREVRPAWVPRTSTGPRWGE